MAEKASIFQTVQIGIETTPGTAVAANRKMQSLSIVPSVKVEGETFRPAGMKYPAFAYINREWTEAKVEGQLTYNEILYPLTSLFGSVTPVQQGATAAYKWTFVSNSTAPDASKTLTIEQGDATTAWRAAGVQISGLEFEFTSQAAKVSGSGVGLKLETGITLTASPTSMTPKVIMPAQARIKMSDTLVGLDSAPDYCRAFGLNWKLTDKFGLAYPLCDPFSIEAEPTLEYSLKVDTGAVGLGLIATMRAGETKWFRLIAEGATIESPYKYAFQIDFPAQITDVGEFGDDDGVYMAEYTMTGLHDAAWGKAFEISVINTESTL